MTEKKVWLITGAGRGLGVEIAKAVLSTGHAVVATGRRRCGKDGTMICTGGDSPAADKGRAYTKRTDPW